ncbi:rhodanese domain-containing protein CG4456-like isoform X1 [Diabrotica virgifera virgifera]|uniref:Rhodanese domain-containing protein n=1 Tax=Diabrotica virgifera virgifera TaxID=50390 RepID=A0ABM5JTQ7_DIAVI|nr:rhodanese domain-containing protein CG4456-like isoform X1 [Diabrotica virgifera virgifera]
MLLNLVNKRLNIRTVRNLVTTMADKIVNIDEVEKVANDNNVWIVDVREPDEVKSSGLIGKSINIPLGTVKDVLKDSSNEAFQNNYGRPKPEANSPLIFYCMKGGRAAKAAEMAESVGFKNAKYYQGSWTEWSSKHS